jgi:hypothetical protein
VHGTYRLSPRDEHLGEMAVEHAVDNSRGPLPHVYRKAFSLPVDIACITDRLLDLPRDRLQIRFLGCPFFVRGAMRTELEQMRAA